MKVQFKEWPCIIRKLHYSNGRVALELIHAVDGDPIARASVNLVEESMAPDEIAIKDYAENEGMLSTLIEAKIISTPLRFVTNGFVQFPICKLLI